MKKYSLMILSCVVAVGSQVDAMSVRERVAQLNAASQQPAASQTMVKGNPGRLSDARIAQFEGTVIPQKTQAPPAKAAPVHSVTHDSVYRKHHNDDLHPAIYSLSLSALQEYAHIYDMVQSMVAIKDVGSHFFMMLLEFSNQVGDGESPDANVLMHVFPEPGHAGLASDIYGVLSQLPSEQAEIILHILGAEFGDLDTSYANDMAERLKNKYEMKKS